VEAFADDDQHPALALGLGLANEAEDAAFGFFRGEAVEVALRFDL
jgi:hypothetical protein